MLEYFPGARIRYNGKTWKRFEEFVVAEEKELFVWVVSAYLRSVPTEDLEQALVDRDVAGKLAEEGAILLTHGGRQTPGR